MVRRLFLPVLLAALAACADNRATIEIRGHAFPSNTTTCAFTAGAAALMQLGPGSLDVAYPPGYGTAGAPTYSMVVYVRNTASDPTKSDTTPGSTSSAASWRALAARIRLNPSDYTGDFPPNPPLLPIQLEARVPLDGQTTRAGEESAQALLVLEPTTAALVQAAMPAGTARTLVVGITLEGEMLDGRKVDSGEWFYSIQVCRGCGHTSCPNPSNTFTSCFGAWQDPTFCQ